MEAPNILSYMVVSQIRVPQYRPKYYGPHYRDPQEGPPNFRKPPYLKKQERQAASSSMQARQTHNSMSPCASRTCQTGARVGFTQEGRIGLRSCSVGHQAGPNRNEVLMIFTRSGCINMFHLLSTYFAIQEPPNMLPQKYCDWVVFIVQPISRVSMRRQGHPIHPICMRALHLK